MKFFKLFSATLLALLIFAGVATAQNGAPSSESPAPAAVESPTAPLAENVPADFQTDGCTKFPDGNYFDCCRAHDLAYYFGGTWSQRWKADKKLYQCVAAKPKLYNKIVAPMMWLGVRALGGAWLGTKASWGFGVKDKKTGEKKAAEKSSTEKKKK